ncbi:hypothetical protein PTTG_07032 [Puccinia triticina 1-1 BBBD Race 1]|uniref:Uncharacterized protein n=2 Tax=Puccinia triticina TaxID=208348 RepID=A0A180GEU0_PUCT1|nr:uncharacterized protein PtA15_17A99 [Puccinia triticina]OAV90968.1 hypothetical protein PTTG_07032 [Puccinia triticina 1-1 BBBD Race 1]WAQ92617.1 hypothetical protein PtA15_17A99 [Puccinia triticina]WAR63497.1 hypothetical protein PtB15_17B97 [Puccinia triticina]
MPTLTSLVSYLYVALSLTSPHIEVNGAPLDQRDIIINPSFHEFKPLRRRASYKALLARSPQETTASATEVKKATSKTDKKQNKNALNEAGRNDAKELRRAASDLLKATNNVDQDVLIIQNPNSSAEEIKKAAEDALKNEEAEDFPREALASVALDPAAAQGALAVVRDQGPTVVQAFKEIHKNAEDKAKVREELAKVTLARLQVVPANLALIGDIPGGSRRLISKVAIGPSQQAIGKNITDATQKKTVEEQQKNLASQTKIVDEQMSIIQKEGSKPEEIEQAAKKALVQEAGEEFARIVLASAATDPKGAMAALAEVRQNGPSKVVHGLKLIESNAKDPAAVKKAADLVVEGRKHVVPANLKLIELSGGSASSNTSVGTGSASADVAKDTKIALATALPTTGAAATTAAGATTAALTSADPAKEAKEVLTAALTSANPGAALAALKDATGTKI